MMTKSTKISCINKNTAKSIIKQSNKNGGVMLRGKCKRIFTVSIRNKIDQIIENPCITPITSKRISEKSLKSEHIELSTSSIRNVSTL